MTIRIGRRRFMAALGGAAVAWPVGARTQPAAMPVIGFLNGQSADTYAHLAAAFRRGLGEAGFIEGQNVAIEYRWANNRLEALPTLAAELVGRAVNVLVTTGSLRSSLAGKAATATIPMVFITGFDPVEFGFVASLNRPGGNITGVSFLTSQLVAKRLGIMQKLIPGARRVGMIIQPENPAAALDMREAKAAAQTLDQTLLTENIRTAGDFEPVFASLVAQHADAIVFGADPFFNSKRDLIVALAARHRLPTMYELRDFVVDGGLISYGTSISDAYRQAGLYAARILKGEKPADLPVLQPTKFELVINLKAASALGIDIPPTLLAVADEVIE